MKFQTIKYEQPGGVFYACVIPASKVIHKLEIRKRADDDVHGIQRNTDIQRTRAIAAYLQHDNAIIPTPILVSISSSRAAISGNILEVMSPEDSVWGHILDGQHRILGLRILDPIELERIELLVVFVFDIDVFSEATIFATINSNQKQVSKSLIYDLFGLSDKWSKERECHDIAKSLNEDSSSPFFGRLKMLGAKTQESETLSQAAFIDRILDAAKAPRGIGAYLEPEKGWQIRRILENAFIAANSAAEQAGGNYQIDYFLRTTGYGGVLKALNALVRAGRSANDLTTSFFQPIFSKMLELFPDPPGGTGNQAQLIVRDRIFESMRSLEINGFDSDLV